MNLRKLALASLVAAAAGIPAMSQADSDLGVGANASAAVDLQFSVVIPRFVYFQVGASAVPGAPDTVVFDLGTGPVEPGTGTDVADANGPVDVVLRSNASVTIAAEALAGSGPLAAGSTEILLSSSTANIPLPAFGTTSAAVVGPVNASGNWTFTYTNNGVYLPQTYTDTVTYTAQTL
jgi:hypothetical protein